MSEYNVKNGPWGKEGEVELAPLSARGDSTSPMTRSYETVSRAENNDIPFSPFAWVRSSFTFKGILARRDYLQLVFMPVLSLLMANFWLQNKLQPVFSDTNMNFSQETFIKMQIYVQNLTFGQVMLMILVTFFVFFCLWSIIVSSFKRLKDCGVNPIGSFIISFMAILGFWPIAVIIFSFIPSQQKNKVTK